jgi:hypothetical protein
VFGERVFDVDWAFRMKGLISQLAFLGVLLSSSVSAGEKGKALTFTCTEFQSTADNFEVKILRFTKHVDVKITDKAKKISKKDIYFRNVSMLTPSPVTKEGELEKVLLRGKTRRGEANFSLFFEIHGVVMNGEIIYRPGLITTFTSELSKKEFNLDCGPLGYQRFA